eukprot:CAMPEP_0196573588 /NCGR_PEP_ID=MMETSP1081-20130531/3476_1 /TAXON_ID=36882 /ORGANISM="Pyramimonas amylifera, Strain CCMP720" /LENGTH=85 /DNA_ID=CAMNT_0041891357 /DNA_START=148 /DNA_END=401 /DNA_ORIENTATION=+
MRAVEVTNRVQRYDASCQDCFRVSQVGVPEFQSQLGEVLVHVARSQINPSDTSFFKGQYGLPLRPPSRAGFEGCGTVVRASQDAA